MALKRLTSFFLTLPVVTALALGLSTGTFAKAAGGKTLVIALSSDSTGLDPETVENNDSGYVMSAIYDDLVAYKPGSTDVEYTGIASQVDISKDGLTYTFTIRPGIKFTDGTPCDADAVVKWLDRLLNKDNPNYYAKRPGIDSFVPDTFHNVDKWYKEGADKAVVHMTKPDGSFLNSLAMVWMGVTSPAAVEKYGLEFYKHPVGTGPFKLVEWVPNDHVTLEANKNYWKGAPKIDRIVYRVIPESTVRAIELMKGSIDVIADITPTDALTLEGKPGVHLIKQPGLMILGIALPTQTKPFDDVRVRLAFNYGVNKDTLCKFVFKGLATPMNAPMPPSQWGYDKTLPGYPYNPEKAKKLLADAGYPNGLDATLYIYPAQRSYNSAGGPAVGQAVQNDLKQIGVNLSLQQLEFGAFLAKTRSKEFSDLCLAGWSGDNGDPDNFLGALWRSNTLINSAHYSSKAFDDLLAKGLAATTVKDRVAIYKQAQKVLNDDAPWIYLNYATQMRAHSTKVHGMVLNPTAMFFGMDKVSKD